MRHVPVISLMPGVRCWAAGGLLALCTGAGTAGAQTVEQDVAGLAKAVWMVDVNHGKPVEQEGLTDGRHVLLQASLLDELGILAKPKLMHLHGKDYFMPQSIQGAQSDIDFDELAVHIVLPGRLLKEHVVNLSEPQIRTLTPEPPWAAYLDYRYYRSDSQGRTYQQGMLAPHLRLLGWSLYDVHVLADTPAGFSNTRYETVAFHDWPERALRLLVGDYTPGTGDLGASFPLAGVTLLRAYALQPGQVINPTASMTGIAQSPSQAQIYMDGVMIASTQLGPGPFNFQNLQGYGGLRDISVLVTDASGNQRTYRVPYYFSNQLLKAGFDTFELSAGSPRSSFGSGGYSGKAASVSYLYGVTDAWTIGTNDSYLEGDRRLSPLMTFGLGPAGTLTGMSAQRQHDHRHRYAHEINYEGQWQRTELRVQWRHAQKGFDDALSLTDAREQPLPDLRARDRYAVNVSQTLGMLGTLSLSFGRLHRFDGAIISSESLSWALRLPWRGQLNLSGLYTRGGGTRMRGLFCFRLRSAR